MTPEKDAELCEKYPKIFENRNDKTSRQPIAWGIECGDGWWELLDTLCGQIQHHVDQLVRSDEALPESERFDRQVRAMQVKEKFGGLRFYTSGSDQFVDGLVRLAESISYRTCEDCGNSGVKRSGGWIRVLCDVCHGRRPEQ